MFYCNSIVVESIKGQEDVVLILRLINQIRSVTLLGRYCKEEASYCMSCSSGCNGSLPVAAQARGNLFHLIENQEDRARSPASG
jgi:hypothetical protein